MQLRFRWGRWIHGRLAGLELARSHGAWIKSLQMNAFILHFSTYNDIFLFLSHARKTVLLQPGNDVLMPCVPWFDSFAQTLFVGFKLWEGGTKLSDIHQFQQTLDLVLGMNMTILEPILTFLAIQQSPSLPEGVWVCKEYKIQLPIYQYCR